MEKVSSLMIGMLSERERVKEEYFFLTKVVSIQSVTHADRKINVGSGTHLDVLSRASVFKSESQSERRKRQISA